MAALVLSVIGTAVAGPIGGIAGALAGSFIDRALFAQNTDTTQSGPRLTDLSVMSSAEGAAVARCFGRMRLDTQLIWSSAFHEIVTTTSETTGGGKSSGGGSTVTTTNYSYNISFAAGLCEGPIVDIGRVWADGNPLDMSQLTWRLYLGDEAQGADPKIEAVEGAGNVPGFRGLAYLVFEEMPLEAYGNRIPQITVEVITPGESAWDFLPAVDLIPALGEFAYATDVLFKTDDQGNSSAVNLNCDGSVSDFVHALDDLQSQAANVGAVALAIGWHGDDLACGTCLIQPEVEQVAKTTSPWSWQVSGLTRETAVAVSSDSSGPLLGGAPADRSVVQAIAEIKARGLRVTLYPLLMMDIPSGNTLANPYSDGAAGVGQPPFPWRGRVTCSPAAGYVGSVDQTATAATQVADFFGTAAAGDFGAWDGDTVPYSGPAEWSYRRFILHYATLAVAAGGVDAFLIGSEMVALNNVRSDATTFPAVAALATLAADVKAIVGAGCKVGYAADWSEWSNFRPDDGSNDLFFHLDPLWAASDIDFIGIDNYMPIADWRDGLLHLDAVAGATSIYDQSYLQGNVEGGELYDWYYASSADRDAQTRTTIADATYGEPWVFKPKDIRNWWLNSHHNRPGGVRDAGATGWTPQSKPIRFTEFGCPAIDKGPNQPNVFYDPKSSESFYPYYSTGARDDLAQRAFDQALIEYWTSGAGHNPTSSVYADLMIDHDNCHVWTWDARPYPQFPDLTDVWRDGPNWRVGHWITGRTGFVTLADVVSAICAGFGVTLDVSRLNAIVLGYLINQMMSPRDALGPLMQVYYFDAVESGTTLRFVQRGGAAAASFAAADLADLGAGGGGQSAALYTLLRAQETDLPQTVHLQFPNADNEFQTADVYSRRLKGSSQNNIDVRVELSLDFAAALGVADRLLTDAWVMRESAGLALPPSAYALEPCDVVEMSLNGRSFTARLDEIGHQPARPAKLTRTDAITYVATDGAVS